MGMNQSGTLTLVRRYNIDRHERDSKLRTFLESLEGEYQEQATSTSSQELMRMVVFHERDMRAHTQGSLRRRGILRQATLEHVDAAIDTGTFATTLTNISATQKLVGGAQNFLVCECE